MQNTGHRVQRLASSAVLSGAMVFSAVGGAVADPAAQAEPAPAPAPAPAKSDSCTPNPAAPEIQEALDKVNRERPNNHDGWKYTGTSNFSPCSDLSFALADQAKQGSAQSSTVLLMFHKGEFIGTDSDRPQHINKVTPTPDGKNISVIYHDWEAQEAAGAPNADAAKFTSNVHFFWNGDHVVHEGKIPGGAKPAS
ncbi:LppP/LprE family lipoprotein [Corynebacterium sp. 5QC2CO]|uniref:LppP/LprE family lipoprotein n=1 Tax=Corynebacterium sp. 5QC2CO TaxID=2968468 RepID=UPI00211C39B6|nr:LppP/LprE family lipoprotein [Corynebacterium sp. 5QC2CO]MCQ9350796.1 LppP/LprE family lipoprotein [Corynebacterium sp. 5QC2CO]